MTQPTLVSRSTLTLLVALSGMIVAWQTPVIVGRYGPAVYFLLIGLVALGLAALARRRPT